MSSENKCLVDILVLFLSVLYFLPEDYLHHFEVSCKKSVLFHDVSTLNPTHSVFSSTPRKSKVIFCCEPKGPLHKNITDTKEKHLTQSLSLLLTWLT